MHASLFSNACCFKLDKLGAASLNNYELAELLDIHCERRGQTPGYEMEDAFFYDDVGRIAMVRISRDIVAVRHVFERVRDCLRNLPDGMSAEQLSSQDDNQVALEDVI